MIYATQKRIYSEKDILRAYEERNWQKAYKVCHSVKGVAAVINAASLNNLAKDLEHKFKDGVEVGERAVTALCQEIAKVVSKLQPTHATLTPEAVELLEIVQKLIDLDDMSAINYVKMLQKVPGTETLAAHLKEYDLVSAGTEIELLLRRA